jgi:thiamine-phosphate pyrophosphorylase
VKISGSKKTAYSIIDANINRAKEGLRVSEDIARFVLGSKKLSSKLKAIRHAVDSCAAMLSGDYLSFLRSRDSGNDAGRRIKNTSEFKRTNLREILASNFKRAEESLRVLEEMSKLSSVKAAAGFKELRYRTYEAEKSVILAYEKKS